MGHGHRLSAGLPAVAGARPVEMGGGVQVKEEEQGRCPEVWACRTCWELLASQSQPQVSGKRAETQGHFGVRRLRGYTGFTHLPSAGAGGRRLPLRAGQGCPRQLTGVTRGLTSRPSVLQTRPRGRASQGQDWTASVARPRWCVPSGSVVPGKGASLCSEAQLPGSRGDGRCPRALPREDAGRGAVWAAALCTQCARS